MSHLTNACEHELNESCERCESGCTTCGILESETRDSFTDQGRCWECAEFAAYSGNTKSA